MTAPTESVLSILLFRLWRRLPAMRRHQGVALLVLMVVGAVAEVVSLGAALPFLGVLVAPSRVWEQGGVVPIARVIGVTTPEGLRLPMTVLFAATAVAAGAVRLLVSWASTRYCVLTGIDVSLEMYRRTLYQPYPVHLARNSSEVIAGIATKTSTVVFNVFLPLLTGASAAIVLLSMIAAALLIDSQVALWAALGFGCCYLLVTVVSRRRLQRNSSHMAASVNELYRTLQEGLGGIRDVLLDGSQEFYTGMYHKADRTLRLAQGDNTFISVLPRPAMEALGMAVLAFVAYAAFMRTGDLSLALPSLGALAVGAQRMIPAFQQVYGAWSTVAGSTSALSDTLALLEQPLPIQADETGPPLKLTTSLRFKGVGFRYGLDSPWVFSNVNFTVPRGGRVGIVGTTGSGKSTLVDLIMGLLEPSAGTILIDETPLTARSRRAWQRTLAHVPQSVFLADASLSENIALGVVRSEIDLPRLREAARRAQLVDFIERSPEGYDAMVGERGVRLSGGQRQRIGIARALYKQASILILDEATSALDSDTEGAVMTEIEHLGRDLTMVLVAHRLTTLRGCDQILEVHAGGVRVYQSYEAFIVSRKTLASTVPLSVSALQIEARE